MGKDMVGSLISIITRSNIVAVATTTTNISWLFKQYTYSDLQNCKIYHEIPLCQLSGLLVHLGVTIQLECYGTPPKS
jgi:hypothetical protein